MYNAFSIDTEDWYHANFEDNLFSNDGSFISTVEKNVDRLLYLFDKNQVKATFFVLGCMVEQHPQMVKKIAKEGHEIASHGYGHQLVYKQTQDEFLEDVKKSKILLEDCVGKEVVGYRAPSWSITEKSIWALDVLELLGFKYNSGIFPTKNFLYGIPFAPRFAHDTSIYGKSLKMITIPPSTYRKFGVNIPFSGGAYFRLFPEKLIEHFTNVINDKEHEPTIFYLHPREIDPEQPKLNLKAKEYLIHYYGIKTCERKLIEILKRYEFITIRDLLELEKGLF